MGTRGEQPERHRAPRQARHSRRAGWGHSAIITGVSPSRLPGPSRALPAQQRPAPHLLEQCDLGLTGDQCRLVQEINHLGGGERQGVVLIWPAQPSPLTRPGLCQLEVDRPDRGCVPTPHPPPPSPSPMLTLSEVVMTSMPSPSSCVKNCDATLRRVTLSPLLPAMAAAQYALEKEKMGRPSLTARTGSALRASPCLGCKCT